MLKRFFALVKALFAAEPKMLDDPERLLNDAQTEVREVQARNRKRAVEAVTAKNNFQKMCGDTRERIDKLTDKINATERRGDKEKAKKLRRDREHEEELAKLEEQLARADEMIEQAMRDIEREEEEIRQKTRDALELKAQWRHAQMPYPAHMRPFNPLFNTLFGCGIAVWLLLVALILFGGKIVSQLNF